MTEIIRTPQSGPFKKLAEPIFGASYANRLLDQPEDFPPPFSVEGVWQEMAQLNLGTLPQGTYRVGVVAAWIVDSPTSKVSGIRFLVNEEEAGDPFSASTDNKLDRAFVTSWRNFDLDGETPFDVLLQAQIFPSTGSSTFTMQTLQLESYRVK